MFDLFNGLPLHPLVVHAVTVLVPLSVLGTIAVVLRPIWRERYGTLLLGVTAVATVLVPIATSSGEALAKRVGQPGYDHAELGDQLKWFVIPLLLLLAVYILGSRRRLAGRGRQIVAALTVVAALATAWQTYRVGDSGAKSVWHDQVAAKPSQ